MKILFVCPFFNNAHFMESIVKLLKKNIKNDEYKFICLNDAPDIDNGDENYLNIILLKLMICLRRRHLCRMFWGIWTT